MIDVRSDHGARLLNESEREILTLAGQGYGSAGIAEVLAIRADVVRDRIETILDKLGLEGRLQLWQYAATHPRPRALQGEESLILARRSQCDNGAGLRRVATGLLHEALEDLSDRSLGASAYAGRWIAGSHEGGLSFDLCCKLSDRSPAIVRRGLLTEPGVAAANLWRNFWKSRELQLKAA